MKGRLSIDGQVRERFWSHVDKSGDCWIWIGATRSYGYGTYKYQGRMENAHRLTWTWENGPIPPGMFVCHRCDTPRCVRVSHLFLGTPAQNSADMVAKGRSGYGEAHPNARLTEAKVREARAMRDRGDTLYVIADHFGVSRAAIGHALSGRNWGYLEKVAVTTGEQVTAW